MKPGSYLLLLIILLVDLLGMLILVSRSVSYVIFELFLVVLFVLLAAIIMVGIYKNKEWSWKIASLFFLLLLINLAFTYLHSYGIYVFGISSIMAAFGFIIAVINIEKERKLKIPPPPSNEKHKEDVNVETYGGKAKKSFKPGKYIGSERGATYHKPKCDWAKKIKTPVWFNSEEEAKAKGYKPHSCM
jgi:hypothetical protein